VTVFLLALVIFGTVAGDLLKAAAMRRLDGSNWRTMAAAALKSPLMWASIAGYAVSFFGFMALLSIEDVSFAVPATAAGYVVETVLAQALLHERVTPRRWAGAAFVALGVALVGD